MELDVCVDLPDGGTALAGRLFLRRQRGVESASLRYDDEWLARPGAYALDPQLPLTTGAFHTGPGQVVFRALADSAPDRWGVELALRSEGRRARREGTMPRSLGEADLLLAVRDHLRLGALRLREPGSGAFLAPDHAGVPQLTDLPRLLTAAARLDDDAETDDELRLLLDAGSSLGGARPKANVVDRGRLWIAKFPRPSRDPWTVTAWEQIALDMARDCGIDAAVSRIELIANRPVLLVERFDRASDGRRTAYVSALTMLEARDGDRRSYIDIADAVERHSPRASEDLRELWRRIAFSVLISNADDHLRNHGFLRADGGWALAPAFDLNPAPDTVGLLSTTIDGTGGRRADITLLVEQAALYRVHDPAAELRRILEATGTWRRRAERLGVGAEVQRLAPAFEHPERVAARRIAGV